MAGTENNIFSQYYLNLNIWVISSNTIEFNFLGLN